MSPCTRVTGARRPVVIALLGALTLLATLLPGTSTPPAHAQSADGSGRPVIVALGDSITAGYGLPSSQAWPSLLQEQLNQQGYDYRVVNAGVSGDTSAGGLARVDWVLRSDPRIVIVALGGNDGLRGLPPAQMQDNLAQIIEKARDSGAQVLLCGMRMPANYGGDYTRRFAAVYPDLAEQYDVALVPFLLDGVAMDQALNQADGIHPNPEGQRVVMENVWQGLQPLLRGQE